MYRAGCVGVVGKRIPIGQLEWPGRKSVQIFDTRIRGRRGQTCATGDEKAVIVCWKTILRLFRQAKAVVLYEGVCWTACKRCRENGTLKVVLIGTQQECIRCLIFCSVLLGLGEVRPRCAVLFHNSFREKVPDFLTLLWHIGCENVVKTAVFADDHDHMFDG